MMGHPALGECETEYMRRIFPRIKKFILTKIIE